MGDTVHYIWKTKLLIVLMDILLTSFDQVGPENERFQIRINCGFLQVVSAFDYGLC